MSSPTQDQLDLAVRIGIDAKALEGISRGQLERVIRLKMREGGKEKIKEETKDKRRKIIEERRLVPGAAVTFYPRWGNRNVYHVKKVTSGFYIILEERRGNFNPVGLYPAA